MTEYFEGFGFGLPDEPEAHAHSWLARAWRSPDLLGMEIYDCSCGARRIVLIGGHPDNFEDAPALPFPASCPRQSNQI
jgi:hypothetical protein